MKTYLSVLGREPSLSLAELRALFSDVKKISPFLATFSSDTVPNINRLGGSLKIAEKLDVSPLDYLNSLEPGKITLGVSDYSKGSSKKSATLEALKLKKILSRHGRSVRVLENREASLSTATSHHNQIAEKKNHIELIRNGKDYYSVIGVQNITAYAHRDQARPARDARVGMLPPKLAQILINLCGPLERGSIILDPFCGTGVVLQESALMGYRLLGTDIEPRMIEYTEKNLDWLSSQLAKSAKPTPDSEKPLTNHPACAIMGLCVGDARDFDWQKEISPHTISAVACETYLGPPMSTIPPEIKLRTAKDTCRPIILGFLRNLSSQIQKNTPVVIATPAWLRENGSYSSLDILDEVESLGYNVSKVSGKDSLLYFREGQIVAREIIILRKA